MRGRALKSDCGRVATRLGCAMGGVRLGAEARREPVEAVTLAVGFGRRAAWGRQESLAGR